MTFRRLSTLLFTAALASPMFAFAAADANSAGLLELKYDWNTREKPAVAIRDTCPVHVVPTEDDRQNKETVGAGVRGPLLTGEASPWISAGLLRLKDFGFAVDQVDGAASPRDGLRLETTLTRAYTWRVGLKIFSMVAVNARFVDKNGVLQEKHYRAHGDKTNMWGADSEYIDTLNYGLNNLLPVMARDLVSLCKGTQVEPYTYAGPEPVTMK